MRTMCEIKDRFLNNTQWAYQISDTNIICSHAGISKTWVKDILHFDNTDNLVEKINALEPSEKFGFNGGPGDMYGEDPQQPLTWIRPWTLINEAIPGYTQIVGHTPQEQISKIELTNDKDNHLYLCDTLDKCQYLIIDDGKFEIKTLKL